MIIHIPSEYIAAFDPEWGAGLLGVKAHSKLFDHSILKRTVPKINPSIPFH